MNSVCTESGSKPSASSSAAAFLDRHAAVSAGLSQKAPPEYKWIWDGFLACRQTTLLVSQWKVGKTTLLSVLLKKLATGGELAGQKIVPAKALIVSEEDATRWHQRVLSLGIGDHVTYLCQPDFDAPAAEAWPILIDVLLEAVRHRGVRLVVVDPLAGFLSPAVETNPQAMSDALRLLLPLKQAGAAVLLLHHPRKGRFEAGQSARGTGVLSAVVDISLELSLFQRNEPADRRRRLHGWSRHAQTPAQAVIEWSEDGLDYAFLGDFENAALRRDWAALWNMFDAADSKLTVKQMSKRWPSELGPVPDVRTINRRLEAALASGFLVRSGNGTRTWPFLYFLPDQSSKPDFDMMDSESVEDWIAQETATPAAATPASDNPGSNRSPKASPQKIPSSKGS